MNTVTKKSKAPQQAEASHAAVPSRSLRAPSPDVRSIHHLQRVMGNHSVLRYLQAEGYKRENGAFIQPKLTVNAPDDPYEREADRIAAQVMRMPAPRLQRACACGGRCDTCRQKHDELEHVQTKRVRPGGTKAGIALPVVQAVLRSPGQPLDAATRRFMEPRFGHDFSAVRVHTDARAAASAQAIGAAAYTAGRNIVFGSRRYAPNTDAGKRLLAHELTHTIQQGDPALRTAPVQRQALQNRPSAQGTPCACLVFIHNNERNARMAAENLHRACRFNLAIIEAGSLNRRIPAVGVSRADATVRDGDLFVDDIEVQCGRSGACSVDPNELFTETIQDRCTRDAAACERYVAGHNDFTAQQMQYFLAIRTCSNNFALPTIALHNNVIGETRRVREAIPRIGSRLSDARLDVAPGQEEGAVNREEFRARIERLSSATRVNFTRLLTFPHTTNIFRWCYGLPEISRCHIGDPARPDYVVWVTNRQDFDTLSGHDVNVVLQEGAGTPAGSESETDLSTLFERLGPDAHFVNIETPHTAARRLDSRAVRQENMIFILRNLSRLGYNCCEAPEERSSE